MTTPFQANSANTVETGQSRQENTGPAGETRPRRNRSLMRKYEVATLGADGCPRYSQHIAPATPAFEAAFSAFARGAVISTLDGPRAIEDLEPGTLIETRDGPPAPVVWVGSLTVIPTTRAESPGLLKLTRIMADAFGLARPMPDLVTGPAARLLRSPASHWALAPGNQLLAPIRHFTDGMNVFEIGLSRPVSLYHLCLPHHAVINVSGLDMETFHPGSNFLSGMGANMKSLFMSLFPHLDSEDEFGPLAYPRAGPDIIDSLNAA